MGTQLRLILSAYIVNMVLTYVQLQNQFVHQAVLSQIRHDESEFEENFQNSHLFDSVATNNEHRSEIYRKGLGKEVAKGQQAFDTMKEELWSTQNRNSYKTRNYYSEMRDNDNIRLSKRETNENGTDTIDAPTNPDTFYREIVQRAIELMWSQEAHLLQMKIRESSIRRKSKQSAIEMQNIITDTDALYKREMDILSDRYWAPKPDQKNTVPLIPEVIEHFKKNWKQFEDLVETDLKLRPNVETDCNEIKEEMRKAQTKLQAGYEEIKEQMKLFKEVRDRAKKAKKPPG